MWPLEVVLFSAALIWCFRSPIRCFFLQWRLFFNLIQWTRSRAALSYRKDADVSSYDDFQCTLCMSPIAKYLQEELMKQPGNPNWPCYVFKANASIGKSCGSKYFLSEMMEKENMIGIHIAPSKGVDYELGFRRVVGAREEAEQEEFIYDFLQGVAYGRFSIQKSIKGMFMRVRTFFSSNPGAPCRLDLSPVVVFLDCFDEYSEKNKIFATEYMRAANEFPRVATVFLCQDDDTSNAKSIADEISRKNGKAKIQAWGKLVHPECEYAKTARGLPVESKEIIWCGIEWSEEEITNLVTKQEYHGEKLALSPSADFERYKHLPRDAIEDALTHFNEMIQNRRGTGGSTDGNASDYHRMTDDPSNNLV